ncbi:hypothetical protein GJ496_002998 [Pomphorhynchus laevis]|nr:hypothetical protein GJ496_002998 [Pomphorhynchus laevis]
MTVQNIETLDKAKWSFLERYLGLSQKSSSRLVAWFTKQQATSWASKERFSLANTSNYQAYTRIWLDKIKGISDEYYEMPAMKQSDWKSPNFSKRHLIARVSTNGYHSKFCEKGGCMTGTQLDDASSVWRGVRILITFSSVYFGNYKLGTN